MHARTEPPQLLFVTAGSDELSSLSDKHVNTTLPVSHAAWPSNGLPVNDELPDCILVSESLSTQEVSELASAVQDISRQVPVVAFVGEGRDNIDELFDAGVTDVIRSNVANTPQTLLDRRIDAALSIAGEEDTASTADKESPQLSRAVTESIDEVVWVNDIGESGLQYINSTYEDVWGRSPEPLYEDRSAILETVHPEDRERVSRAMEQQRKTPEEFDLTFRIVRPDGEQRWVHSRAIGIREDNELVRIVGIASDITERKTKKQELAAERDVSERILEASPVGVLVLDTDGTVTKANQKAESILGTSHRELEEVLSHLDEVGVRDRDGQRLSEQEFPFRRIVATGEPIRNEQYILEPPGTSEETVITVYGVPLFDGECLEAVVITVDDVTERVARERRLQEQRDELAELDQINSLIRDVHEALLDTHDRDEMLEATCEKLTATGTYQHAVALRTGRTGQFGAVAWTKGAKHLVAPLTTESKAQGERMQVRKALDTNRTQVFHHQENINWFPVLNEAGINSYGIIPVVYEGAEYGVIAVFSSGSGQFGSHIRTVLDELGKTVGHAIAGIESREREETLTALYRATEQFLTAESPEEASELAVETAMEVLDFPGIGVFLFDEETNLLSPVAGTEEFLSFLDESTVFGPAKRDSVTWHTYVTGESQCYADIQTMDRFTNSETSARASLLLPLGEHGVFVAASTEAGVFTEQRRQLVGLLAATTEAALDRVAGQADIRERDQALESRTEQLDRTESLLSVSQDITTLVRDAQTRAELEQRLCERLTEHDYFSLAWIGKTQKQENELVPRVWAGSEEGYLDAVSLQLSSDEPAVRAIRTGETTTVSNVTSHIREQRWPRKAVDRGHHSVLAVPLVNGQIVYGVVALYSSQPGLFSEVDKAVAEDFGATLAYGINSIETRRGLLSEQATELEVRIGQTETFFNEVAALVGEPVSYRELTPVDAQNRQLIFSFSDPPVEEILALGDQFVSVTAVSHTQRGETDIFRATVSGEPVGAELLDCGGVPQAVTATARETQATVRLPTELRVRTFLDRVRDRYPDAELHSRRDTGAMSDSGNEVRRALDEELTDRQREVLLKAYETGFFQSPRETTGEELAGLLDLSQPTVAHHLREAQYRLLTALFETQ
ncbi:GAF domain-containing protein [Halovenus rubra]|uniref:histidine kinase n=2 Tax=Halovenus rubra TaxID=869890 RepID=A0ABD5X630_9EURY|nr:GAF domain-containing protein [Halovenus rubra]